MTEIRRQLVMSDWSLEEANRLLGYVQDRLDEIEGRRGTPTFKSSIDVEGNPITNLPESQFTSLWPVGSIFISVVSMDPADLLGFGTWETFGAGKFLVGLDEDDTDFDTAEETGGAKTKDVSHTHAIDHTHGAGANIGAGAAFAAGFTGSSGSGGSAAQDILPPYITVYMWKRTA